MSKGDHLGQCLHFRHLDVGVLYTLSVSEHVKLHGNLSACIKKCACPYLLLLGTDNGG